MGHVREYRDGDGECVFTHLREADRQELTAVVGSIGPDTFVQYLRASPVLYAIVGSGERPAGLFGVQPTSEMAGTVWLLGTDALVQAPLRRQFLREGRRYLDDLHRFRPLLFNLVDERNTVHIRWIEWMGFTFIGRQQEYGVERRPFLAFMRLN